MRRLQFLFVLRAGNSTTIQVDVDIGVSSDGNIDVSNVIDDVGIDDICLWVSRPAQIIYSNYPNLAATAA